MLSTSARVRIVVCDIVRFSFSVSLSKCSAVLCISAFNCFCSSVTAETQSYAEGNFTYTQPYFPLVTNIVPFEATISAARAASASPVRPAR
jgi:hypothetical protein